MWHRVRAPQPAIYVNFVVAPRIVFLHISFQAKEAAAAEVATRVAEAQKKQAVSTPTRHRLPCPRYSRPALSNTPQPQVFILDLSQECLVSKLSRRIARSRVTESHRCDSVALCPLPPLMFTQPTCLNFHASCCYSCAWIGGVIRGRSAQCYAYYSKSLLFSIRYLAVPLNRGHANRRREAEVEVSQNIPGLS